MQAGAMVVPMLSTFSPRAGLTFSVNIVCSGTQRHEREKVLGTGLAHVPT